VNLPQQSFSCLDHAVVPELKSFVTVVFVAYAYAAGFDRHTHAYGFSSSLQ
jgi:hypothetical protein